MEDFFTCSDGCRLFYRIDDFTDPWRPAPTVLMVHGLAESGEAWRAWVPYFARHYRVLRVDVRGFGRSTPMSASFNWSIDLLVDDLLALMRHVDRGPVHLVGAKSGGTIAFKLAADHPESVRTLTGVAMSAKGKGDTAEWITQIEQVGMREWARQTMKGRLGSTATQAEFEWWVEALQGRTAVSTMQSYLRMVPGLDIRKDVERIACPALVITTQQGGHSHDDPRHWQPRMKQAQLLVIPGDAWHAAGAYPDRCAQETLAFMERREPRAE